MHIGIDTARCLDLDMDRTEPCRACKRLVPHLLCRKRLRPLMVLEAWAMELNLTLGAMKLVINTVTSDRLGGTDRCGDEFC